MHKCNCCPFVSIVRVREIIIKLDEVKDMTIIRQEASGNIIKGKYGILIIPTICPECFSPHSLHFNTHVEVECNNCHIILE